MTKRLYRSRKDSTIGGVCGGIGEYFGIDPTFVRIITVLLFFADGIGFLAYIIAWIIVPQEPLEALTSESADEEQKPEKVEYASWNRYIPGAILICLGVFFVVREHYWWWNMERFWPLLLVVVGLFLVFRSGKKKNKSGLIEGGTNESSQV